MDRSVDSADDGLGDSEVGNVNTQEGRWYDAARHDEGCQRVLSSRIREFEPKLSWFVHGADGIHGLVHEARVIIWSQVLASLVSAEGLTVDADVLGWAAAVHDTQRWDDGVDPEHGARAADWIGMNRHLLPSSVSVERVQYLCHWHVPADQRAPEMTDELKVFKDADALDRWRIFDLNPKFLRTQAAKGRLDASRALWERTRDFDNHRTSFTEVVRAAAALGILTKD